MAVLSRASSKWCIAGSAGGSWILPFGDSTMTPVPTDYDGVGAADLAMYAAATGTWSIRASATGTDRTETFGGPLEDPVLLLPLIHAWFGLP